MKHFKEFTAYLERAGVPFAQGEPMRLHTSFKIGGPAALFIEPGSEEELSGLLREAARLELAPLIIGRGSNLLVNDAGLDCPVICLGERFSHMGPAALPVPGGGPAEGGVIYAQAGASLTKLCRFAQSRGLSGLEFAFGIPGTVGGAVFMNAGAYGGEMKDVLAAASHLDMADGQKGLFLAGQLELSYRRSVYSDGSRCITGAYFVLRPDEPGAIRARMEDYLSRRQAKQPLELPSAGSTFKRPEGNYASALIDACNLKGRRVGGAQVSEKHAGFVVNVGEATARDVLELVEVIRNEVRAKTGYELECEIKLV